MQIFPAIDLSGGQVVRLYQGDYDKMTVYGADPCAVPPDENKGQVAILWPQVNSGQHITVPGLPMGLFSSCPRESWRKPMVRVAERTRGSGLFLGAEGSGCPLC